MAFWSDPKDSQPKFAYKWKLDIGASNYKPYLVKKISKPSFDLTVKEYKHFNTFYYAPGILSWNETSFTLVDLHKPDTSDVIFTIMKKSGFLPTKSGGLEATNIIKSDAVSALGGLTLTELNSKGEPFGIWKFKGAFITKVNFGDLAYSEDEITEVTITTRYDSATYSKK